MPIPPRKQVRAAATHNGNGGDVKIEEQSEADLKNNQMPEMLSDPEDFTGGSTHSMTASTKAKTKVKAGAGGEPHETNVGMIDNDEDPAEGYIPEKKVPQAGATTAKSKVKAETNVALIDNDEDPASGILENTDEVTHIEAEVGHDEADENDMENDFDMGDDEEVNAVFDDEEVELANQDSATPLEAGEGDEDDEEVWNDQEDASMSDIADDEATEEAEPESAEGEDVAEEPAGESLPVIDVDETPEKDTAELAFAAFGTNLMVIRANRVIATLGAKRAERSGRSDIYLTDQFQQVTASKIAKHGLRAGLKEMGFVLATINVAKSSVINARVKLESSKQVAAVRRVSKDNEVAFQQSLAIATVGINKRYFTEVENPLKAHLEDVLTGFGIRNASRVLHAAFAQHGTAYTKSVLELAKKLSAMPAASRDGFVKALDMTSETMEDQDMGDEDEEAMGAEGNYAEDDDVEFDGPTTARSIAAALGTPGRRVLKSQEGRLSLSASAVLAGEAPLF